MIVRDWMTTVVFSIEADAPLQKAIKLQKEFNVDLIPVIDDGGGLVGVITDRDIKRASISDKIPLDINEAIFLVSSIKVKDVMTSNPITIPDEYTMQEAAEILLNNRISGAPVVNDKENIVGILNRSDALRVLISFTGSDKKGFLFSFFVKDQPGNVGKIARTIRSYGARVASILSSAEKAPLNYRNVLIKVYDLKRENYEALINELKEFSTLRYIVDFMHAKRKFFEE